MLLIIRIGSCDHCGKCCLPPVMVENPCIERHEDRCKFYVEIDNGKLYGHCLIWGRGNRPIKRARDRFGNKITNAQIVWFNQNCIDYPLAKDAQTGVYPPPECSFSFEVQM